MQKLPKNKLIRSWSPKRKREAVVALLLTKRRRARAIGSGESLTVPSAPVGLSLSVFPTYFHLTWTNTADNADGFRLYRCTFVDPYGVVADIPFDPETNEYEFHDSALEIGLAYTYYVVAYNEAGESEPSNTESGEATSE